MSNHSVLTRSRGWIVALALLSESCCSAQEFLLITDFTRFEVTTNRDTRRVIWSSARIRTKKEWDSLVVSWNARAPADSGLEIQVLGRYPDHETAAYSMGIWSESTNLVCRKSVARQKDQDGHVATDVLHLERPCRELRLRILQYPGRNGALPELKRVALSFLDSRQSARPRSPNRTAWGINLPVPGLSQHAYPGGKVWCSPASVSMVLAYWASRLDRPELSVGVPEVAAGVYDEVWGGTGNWPFNTAFAGRFPALQAYVTRLRDLRAVEDLIARKVPVILSVSLTRLRQRPPGEDDGHLAVVTGFNSSGEVWINDPDTPFPFVPGRPVSRLHPRTVVDAAWAASQRTVYIIEPASKQNR